MSYRLGCIIALAVLILTVGYIQLFAPNPSMPLKVVLFLVLLSSPSYLLYAWMRESA